MEIVLGLSLLTAAASWLVVERPLLRRKDRVGGRPAVELPPRVPAS